jgi:hypothetical protein
MPPREAQAPDFRVGESVFEPTPYEAGGRLKPRPWPVGPSESYGKVDFDDGEGKSSSPSTYSASPKKVTSCTSTAWPPRCGWMARSFG